MPSNRVRSGSPSETLHVQASGSMFLPWPPPNAMLSVPVTRFLDLPKTFSFYTNRKLCLRACLTRLNKCLYRHFLESGNPGLSRRYWTPACAGVTIRGTFWTRSKHKPEGAVVTAKFELPVTPKTSLKIHQQILNLVFRWTPANDPSTNTGSESRYPTQ